MPGAGEARGEVASCCFALERASPMKARARRLRDQLIRNFDDLPKERELRAPLYDTMCARLAEGTAAQALGMAIDIVAPGMRGCPYHLHHAQEEAFVILEGRGSLRVAGEMLETGPATSPSCPPGPTTRTRSSTPRMRRSSTCRSARRRDPKSSNTPTRASTSRLPARADRRALPGWAASARTSTTGKASRDPTGRVPWIG